jgi:hypothetical protein
MSKPEKIPRGARHLSTYAEFRDYLANFGDGIYRFLWIIGRPGVCKTESILAATRGRKVYYRKAGRLTPLQFHIDCYRHRGMPVILDDGEHHLEDPLGRRQVRAMGDTAPTKLMCYGTTSRALGDVPQQYYTTSSLCIISNRAALDDAIQSRAVILHFDPTNHEVHRAVAEWYWSQVVHDWVGSHVSRLRPLDARWYVIADQDRRAGLDWRKIILDAHALDRASCLVQDLERDPACPTREDRARRFVEQLAGCKGASRNSYFRLRKRLEKEGKLSVTDSVGPIPLRHTCRPGVPGEVELESLEARAVEAEEPAVAASVSAREAFARPVQGQPEPGTRRPAALDDLLPWESPEDPEEGDEV